MAVLQPHDLPPKDKEGGTITAPRSRRSLPHLFSALALVAGLGGLAAAAAPTAGAVAGAAVPSPVTPSEVRASGTSDGYWLATADGSVFAAGPAKSLGGTATPSSNPVVGIGATHDGRGYWLVEANGNVLPFGSARSFGNLPAIGTHVGNIVAIAPTGDDGGYWLIGHDGGEFAFGDAKYHGSLPGLGLHVRNIVGMVATSDGGGYWLVGSDGGVFAFGNARYRGSLPRIGVKVNNIRAMIPSPTRNGYILVGSDGGTFVFGTGVNYLGSLPGRGIHVSNIVGLALTGGSTGYWLAGANAATYAFGTARVYATPAGITSHLPVVAIATAPPPITDTTTAAWVLQNTPVVVEGSKAVGSELDGVKCLAQNNCFAVGWAGPGQPDSHSDLPLAERWNGSSWTYQILPHPTLNAASATLNAISCTSPTFCMAVGFYTGDLVTFHSLAEVWNGSTWTAEFPPNAAPTDPAISTEFTSVSCTSSQSCMGVGYYTRNGTAIGLISATWSGATKTWTAGRPVNPAGTSPQLHGVSCVAASACFAVGNYSTSSEVNLIEFWNGSSWSVQKADEPGGASASSLSAVACVNASTCAAVGDFVGAVGTHQTTLAENWNGRTWAVQATPGVRGASSSVLTGVSCPFATDCVAVGSYTTGTGTPLTTAEAWNGKNWAQESTVSPGGSRASFLKAISCGAATFCTAVGNQTTSAGATQALAEQWVLHVGTYTNLVSSANPAVTGQGLVLTATVIATRTGFGTPTGALTFTVRNSRGTALACAAGNSVALHNGSAICTIPSGRLTPLLSPYTVTAVYGGAPIFKPSAGTLVPSLSVGKDGTTVTVTSTVNPATYPQTMDFIATVRANAPGTGTPTGTVTFTVDGQGECDDGTSTFPLNSKGQADCPIQFRLSAGKHVVVATYSGDSQFLASSNSKSPFTEIINQGPTTTTVSAPSHSTCDSCRENYTAIVTAKAPSSGTPFGNVTFTAINLKTNQVTDLNCNGSASDVVPITFDGQFNRYDAQCLAPIGTIGSFNVTAAYADTSPGWAPSSGIWAMTTNAGARPRASSVP